MIRTAAAPDPHPVRIHIPAVPHVAAHLSIRVPASPRRAMAASSTAVIDAISGRSRTGASHQAAYHTQNGLGPPKRAEAVSCCTARAEAEGLEPPCGCPRRISSAVPYQLGLRLPTSTARVRRPFSRDGRI